ncbi:carbonic anhydrase [Corynebacterium camporealensis]
MPLRNVPHEPQPVWDALKEGNQRLIDGNVIPVHENFYREGLTAGQDPRVIVLACSDSRAPIEHLFNIGFGDAFVIRTAGHILDSVVLASLDYALESLNANVLLVLGHQNCGAVAAAASFLDGEADLPTSLQRPIIERVAVSAWAAQRKGKTDHADYERQNTLDTVSQIVAKVPEVQRQLDSGNLGVVGARYLLDSSSVETLVLHGVE